MPMIADPDDLIVGTNITLNTAARTFDFIASADGSTTNGLIAKDGVDANVIWSFFVDQWATATYKPFPFPMDKIDNRSGQYAFGVEPTGAFNGWRPGTDATRQMIRNGGAREFSAAGAVLREYFGAVVNGSVPAGTQCYYQREAGGPAINFSFTDLPNEYVQVLGDASNGNFDTREFFKVFARPAGYTYADNSLEDISESETGPFKLSFNLTCAIDTNITALDGAMASAPYSEISIAFNSAPSNQTIGAGAFPFRKIITKPAGATRFQIYTKMQYLLRQASNINSGGSAGSVIGKTADLICWFVGSTLYSRAFFVPDAADLNDVVFIDDNGVERTFPFAGAGRLTFNPLLTAGGAGTFTMYYVSPPTAAEGYGQPGAVPVRDASGDPIEGTITGAEISFSYDPANTDAGFDGTEPSRTAIVVASNPGVAKPTSTTQALLASKSMLFPLLANRDPSYVE